MKTFGGGQVGVYLQFHTKLVKQFKISQTSAEWKRNSDRPQFRKGHGNDVRLRKLA
jgi:hypothetical protein